MILTAEIYRRLHPPTGPLNIIPYYTILYYSISYNIQCYTIQCYTIRYYTTLKKTILYYIKENYTLLCKKILQDNILY